MGQLSGLAGEIEARILLRQGDVARAGRWADRATPEAPPGSPLLELLHRSMDVTIAVAPKPRRECWLRPGTPGAGSRPTHPTLAVPVLCASDPSRSGAPGAELGGVQRRRAPRPPALPIGQPEAMVIVRGTPMTSKAGQKTRQ